MESPLRVEGMRARSPGLRAVRLSESRDLGTGPHGMGELGQKLKGVSELLASSSNIMVAVRAQRPWWLGQDCEPTGYGVCRGGEGRSGPSVSLEGEQ